MLSKYFNLIIVGLAIFLIVLLSSNCEKKVVQLPTQSRCPVTGRVCSSENSVDAAGVRLFGCQPGCVAALQSNPTFWIEKIRAKGEEPLSLSTLKDR